MSDPIVIFKASPIGSQVIAPVVIEITASIPDSLHVPDTYAVFDSEAESLFEALRNSLPGGTFDRLLIKMLEYKASTLKVLNAA